MSSGASSAGHLSGRPDLPRLTVLRGLGAGVIVIGHFTLMKTLPSQRLNDHMIDLLQALAVAGVSGFFTMSGFVLTWTTPPGTPGRAIWRRRFARLFPVHAVTWALALTVLALAGASGALWKMLPSLGLVNIWVPNLEIFWGPNTPSWTLSTEAFFYALFPLLLIYAWRVPERRLYPALIGLAVTTALWAAFVGVAVPQAQMITGAGTEFSRVQYFAIVVFAPARLLDFVMGMLIARIVIAGKAPQGLRPWVYATVLGGYIVARWVIPQPLGFVCAFVPAVIIGVLYSASADLAGQPSRWANRTLLWMGEISFSLYMVHWAVVYGGDRLLGEPQWSIPEAVVMCALALALSLALAQLLHKTVEMPLYRRLRKARVRPAVAAPDPAVAVAVRDTQPNPLPVRASARTAMVEALQSLDSEELARESVGMAADVRTTTVEEVSAAADSGQVGLANVSRIAPWAILLCGGILEAAIVAAYISL